VVVAGGAGAARHDILSVSHSYLFGPAQMFCPRVDTKVVSVLMLKGYPRIKLLFKEHDLDRLHLSGRKPQ